MILSLCCNKIPYKIIILVFRVIINKLGQPNLTLNKNPILKIEVSIKFFKIYFNP